MLYFTWKLELVSNILWIIVSENLFLILTSATHLQTFFFLFFDYFGNSKAFYAVLTLN